MIKQISIFLPNHPGTLAKLTKLFMENKINMRALTVSETADYGILKIIVDKTEEAANILDKNQYLTAITHVIAVKVEDKPGALHQIAKMLGDDGINIDYLYSTIVKEAAVIVLRVSDNNEAVKILQENNVKLLDQKDF